MPTYIVRADDGKVAVVEAYTIPQAITRIEDALDDKFHAVNVTVYDGVGVVVLIPGEEGS